MAQETLIIRVRADGTRVVQRDIASIGNSATAAAAGVDLLKKALLFVGAAQAVRGVVGTLASFTQAMSMVRAITGATELEFEALRTRAEELGATTRFSATDAAEGLTFLARAGFDVAESLNTIEGTLKLAQAGALDLGSAADITSNVLRGFRLDTTETARVVDVLALAANSSNTTVTQLGEALKFVGPIASGVGLSLEDTVAAISELSNAGLQATLAGTGLRRVISELESPSSKTKKQIQALGVTVERGEISAIGLFAALQKLSDAGVDTGAALEIFGDRGGPAFEVLNSGAGAASRLADQLRNAEGTADRIAEVMDDNLNGALLSVRSAVEAVVLAFGRLGPESVLTQFFTGLASIIRTVASDSRVLDGVLATLGTVAFPLVVKGLNAVAAAAAANPLVTLGLAVATFVGVLVRFRDEITLTGDGLVSLGDFAQATFELLSFGFQVLKKTVVEQLRLIVSFWNDVFGDDLPGTVEGFLTIIARQIDFTIGVFSAVGAVIVTAFRSPFDTVAFLVIELANVVIRTINSLLRLVTRQLVTFKDNIIQIAAAIPGVGAEIAQSIANTRVELPQIDELENPFSAQGEALGNAFKEGFRKSTQAQDLLAGVFDRARAIGDDRRAGPTDDELERQQMLQDLLNGQADATRRVGEATNENTQNITAGRVVWDKFSESMKNSQFTAVEFADALTGIVEAAVDRLADAIADALVNGLQDFDSFKENLSNILKDIAKEIIKLIIKFLILKAISFAFGGGPTPTGENPAAPSTNQAGGPVTGGEPTIVGEQGPELFTPTRSGNITPNSQVGGAQPAPITIVNVSDPDDAINAIGTAAGEQAVMNVIGKNADKVRQLTQGA